MLLDLQLLDVDICQHHRSRRYGYQDPDGSLAGDRPAERARCDHGCACISEQDEENDNVPVDAMEENGFVADDGDELKYHEETCGNDGD